MNYRDAIHSLGVACKVRDGNRGPQLLIRDCPFCGDHRYKLYMATRTGQWICFHCDARGGFKRLFATLAGCEIKDVDRILASGEVLVAEEDETDVDGLTRRLKAVAFGVTENAIHDHVLLPVEFEPCAPNEKRKSWLVPKYLKRRGFSKRTLEEFNIGFCRSGEYAGRVILPVYTESRTMFQARATLPFQKPKYLTPKVSKGRFLFGYDQAVAKKRRHAILVEGIFDAMRLHEYGFTALALFGKSVSAYQRKLIESLDLECLYVCLDSDAAREAEELAAELSTTAERVRLVRLPADTDPDSVSRKAFVHALAHARAV